MTTLIQLTCFSLGTEPLAIFRALEKYCLKQTYSWRHFTGRLLEGASIEEILDTNKKTHIHFNELSFEGKSQSKNIVEIGALLRVSPSSKLWAKSSNWVKGRFLANFRNASQLEKHVTETGEACFPSVFEVGVKFRPKTSTQQAKEMFLDSFFTELSNSASLKIVPYGTIDFLKGSLCLEIEALNLEVIEKSLFFYLADHPRAAQHLGQKVDGDHFGYLISSSSALLQTVTSEEMLQLHHGMAVAYPVRKISTYSRDETERILIND